MTEQELEQLLRRYRPNGPVAGLRTRILGEYRAARVWPWAGAAAALLVVSLMLRTGTAAQVERAYAPPVDAAGAAVDQLAGLLGGTDEARAFAEAAWLQERVRAERAGLDAR